LHQIGTRNGHRHRQNGWVGRRPSEHAVDREVRDVRGLLVAVAGPEGDARGAVEQRARRVCGNRAVLVDGRDLILRVDGRINGAAAIERDAVDALERWLSATTCAAPRPWQPKGKRTTRP